MNKKESTEFLNENGINQDTPYYELDKLNELYSILDLIDDGIKTSKKLLTLKN